MGSIPNSGADMFPTFRQSLCCNLAEWQQQFHDCPAADESGSFADHLPQHTGGTHSEVGRMYSEEVTVMVRPHTTCKLQHQQRSCRLLSVAACTILCLILTMQIPCF